jgi:signal transduction histidine kinase
MNIQKWIRSIYNKFVFRGLSIQQRLPLLISLLLSAVILSYGIASYYTVRKTALALGEKRLHDLTTEIATLFKESSTSLVSAAAAIAKQDTIKSYIKSGGTTGRAAVLDILFKVRNDRTDSTWSLIEVLDSSRTAMLKSGNPSAEIRVPVNVIFSSFTNGIDSGKIGKFYAAGDSMYYPLVGAVTDNKKTIGYVVAWRLLTATPQALQQLSNMMGTGATLYLGNKDGTLWTNMMKPVAAPPVDTQHIDEFLQYTSHGKKVLAAVQPITDTPWYVLIEFSKEIIFETATSFLKWMIVIGVVLFFAGILITWMLSRNIIKPLNQLTAAATAIADGDFSTPVKVNRMDELGKLAQAFIVMASRVKFTQQDLEKLVAERTDQLEKANRELEAFSYSVSHDLRAPLRAITGFTEILEEKYGDTFDAEGKRITSVIKKNGTRMRNLIDDLLSFAKIGRQEMVKQTFQTGAMIQEIINDLPGENEPVTWDIADLPESYGSFNMIRQVWINLISNAKKYSKKTGIHRVEIGSYEQNAQTVFFIKDNGVGFDPVYADKLFKVFQRLHSNAEFEGTGVGLAIVEKIVSRHDGKIWADAKVNEGACFYFSLPHKDMSD